MTAITKTYSSFQVTAVHLFSYLFVGAIASQNGLLGYEKSASSNNIVIVVVAVAIFALCDFAGSILAELYISDKWRGTCGILALVGVIALSLYAGASFWMTQQHKADSKHSKSAVLDTSAQALAKSINASSNVYDTTGGNRVAGDRMSSAQNNLVKVLSMSKADSEKFGTDIDSSNALGFYVARWLGYPYDVVNFCLNFLFNSVAVVTAMALSMSRGLVVTTEQLRKKLQREAEVKALLSRPQTITMSNIKPTGASVEKAMSLIKSKELNPPSIAQLRAKGFEKNIAKKAIDKATSENLIKKAGKSNLNNYV